MDIISEKARNYPPYDFETRLHSVRRTVESGWGIRKACTSQEKIDTSGIYQSLAITLADNGRQCRMGQLKCYQ